MSIPQILLDCTAFHPHVSAGGVSLYKQEVLPNMQEDFRFTAFYKKIDSEVLDACGPVIGAKEEIKGNMLVWRDRAVNKLAKSGAKGVWFPTQFSAWFPALPSLVTVHDMAAFFAWKSFSPLGKAYMPATLFASSLNARRIIVISEASANDLNRLFPWTKKRTVIARHGLPTDVRKRALQIGITRHRSDGPTSMIFLDGANPRKRLDLSLLALEKRGWLDTELTITGNPQAVEKKIMTVLGYLPSGIHCVGRLDRADLLDALASADMLLYPSNFEGFGFPILEAMAFGTSVVSFPGNAEREVGGEYAIFSARRDAQFLSQAIRTAEERCRDTSWQQALMKHALGFTWDDSIAVHRQELGNLVA